MVDLSMHLMDIAQNSIRAEANDIEIVFQEKHEDDTLTFCIKDNGNGMSEETIKKLSDPFFTTRTTRKVGLGVPFLKMTCEQTGGFLGVESEEGKGTVIKAVYKTNNPDCPPLGDLGGYFALLLLANPKIHFRFQYELDNNNFSIDTDELAHEGLTDLQNAEMSLAIKEYINENLKELFLKRKEGSFLCS